MEIFAKISLLLVKKEKNDMKHEKKQRKPLSIPIFLAVYVAVIIACVALDQLTKHFIELAVQSHGRIRIIGNWLTLTWTINTGATGGLFSTLSWRNWLFFFMTLLGIPLFFLLLLRSRTRSVWGQVAFAFVIGGTIGNAIDRIVFAEAERGFFTGGVRDFVEVQGFFGIFNIADSFLVVGVIMALLAIVFFDPDSLVLTFIEERKAKQIHETEQNQLNTDVVVVDTTVEQMPTITEDTQHVAVDDVTNDAESVDENN